MASHLWRLACTFSQRNLPHTLTSDERWLLLLVTPILLATAKSAVVSETGENSTEAIIANGGYEHKAIAVGFKVERYARLWEHDPFVLETPAPSRAQPSAFEQLFLASWLKDGGKDQIIVQNMETNEIQRITAEPNHSNLRLIEMRPNPDPQFAEAVISDGKEKGIVKFRFAAQAAAGQALSLQAVSQRGQTESGSPPNSQIPGSSAAAPSQVPANHIYPGIPRVHREGGMSQVVRRQELRGKQGLASPAPAQPTPGQN
jgi:hypothetical protein